jgi:hypothetical protein
MIRVTQLTILPEGKAIFEEEATQVEIDDDAGGEYVVIKQDYEPKGEQRIEINPEEWPEIRRAVNRIVKEIERWEK